MKLVGLTYVHRLCMLCRTEGSVTTYKTTCCARAFNVAEHAIAVCGLQTNALQNA